MALDRVRPLWNPAWQIDRVLVQSSEKWICCQQCLPDPTTTPAGHIPKQRMTWAEEAAERRGSQNVRIGRRFGCLPATSGLPR